MVSLSGGVDVMHAGCYLRQRANAVEHFVVKRDRLRLVVTDFVRIGSEIHNAVWIEAEIGILRMLQAAQEKSRDDQERERAADLHRDEHAAKSLTAIGRAAAAGIQNVAQIAE